MPLELPQCLVAQIKMVSIAKHLCALQFGDQEEKKQAKKEYEEVQEQVSEHNVWTVAC